MTEKSSGAWCERPFRSFHLIHMDRTSAIKGYMLSILFAAYNVTGDAKYLEPMRLEYELAIKHGYKPEPAGPLKRSRRRGPVKVKAPVGSEKWVAVGYGAGGP